MAFNQRCTHPRVGSIAWQGLLTSASLSLDEIRAVCAAALMNVPEHRQAVMVQARPGHEQIDIALALAQSNELAGL
jgi:hypothetical protein